MVTQYPARHAVQVYETDGYLAQRVVEFLHGGLADRARCVVIATPSHRELFSAGLAHAGVDLDAALASGDLMLLDAQDILHQFMVGAMPDAARFQALLGPVLSRASRDGRKVRAFGEMVDLLWRDGQPDAAIRLEQLWNDLARTHSFELLCAYTIANLYKTSSGRFREICEVHDHAHAPEVGSADENTRLLIAEISRRANLERELRQQIRQLQRAEELERAHAARNLKLQQATGALARAVSMGELCDIVMETSVKLVGANAAVIYLADSEDTFHLTGTLNAPGIRERRPTLALDEAVPLARALATRQSLWLDTRATLRAMFPSLTDDMLEKTHATTAIPFVKGERALGGIALSFETQRAFPDDERALLESFARQCSEAIERVRQYVAESKARNEAENLLRIAESLNDMHLDLEAILQRVTDEATALVGAQFGAFFYNVEDKAGDSYMLYTLSGARKEQFAKLGMPRNTPIFAHTFNGVGIVRLDDVKQDPRYGQMAPHHGMPKGHLPVSSYLAVPVRSRTGKVIGGLFFGHEQPGKFTVHHEHTMRGLAITASIAIDNAELYRKARDAEEAQRKSVEQLVDTVRMNELFTGVLAHDLRSPIAAITTGSEMLLLKANENEKRVLDRVLLSGRRMARMIEQLLDFTRLRVGTGLPLDSKPCDLQALIKHAIDELRAAHPKQSFNFEASGNATGRWDDDRLAQAFSNLIANAAHHGSTERGVQVQLDGTDPNVVRVRIHNAGVIPADLLPRIFEPMIGGQRRRDGTRGLGIGLFITREIASAHGGSVTVETSADAGTTFTLSLPREVDSVAAVPSQAQPVATNERGLDLGQSMRTLVEGVRDCALFMLDERGNVMTWTQTAAEITGWSRDAIMNRPLAVLYSESDRNIADLELGRASKLGVSEHEGYYVRPDGTRLWASVSISAIRSGSGDLVGYATIARDLTEQREARRKMEENNAKFRLMIDSVRDYAIFMLDANGNVASWNTGAQLTKGYTPGEIMGRHISAFYTREDREAGRPQMMIARAIKDGRVEDEGWRVRKDGSRFWADVIITALRDDNGQLAGFAKVTRDLTDRRQAEEELRRSEERFRLLVDSVRDYAIFLLDPSGHVVTWNTGAERNQGYKAHEIVGQHFSKFYDPEEVRAGKCERELEIAARDGRFEEEGWRLRKDGTRFWASVVISPLRGPKCEIVGYAKVTRDLSERKSLEDERVRTIHAQEGIRLRDEFLSIVSHELKTPLAGLLLQVEALATRKNLEAGVHDKLCRARESGERLDGLIETLLDVSRIATGRFVLALERVDLAALLLETLESFQLAAHKAGCELRVEAPVTVVGNWDRVRIGQVFANLLSNALKYGAGRPVHVQLELDGSDAVLTVRDHGPGIDPTMQSRIFERFERAVSTRHYGGLGIGLYVVREIVTAHGGTAVAENSPNGGARFKIRLPMELVA
jgi:PAS domain S-box-containing protein